MTGAVIHSVQSDSIARDLNLQKGDRILSINGNSLGDIIDYYLLLAEEEIDVLVEHVDQTQTLYSIEKDYDDDLGITFSPATITPLKQCHNKCQFCFIDQMPPGHRPTLYVRDDDYRLSFVSGSYITGTNLTETEIKRIISLNLSPLYISVHQTGPQRNKLLGRRTPFDIMALLQRLVDGGILLHTQIVLCPDMNDGEALQHTLEDLITLMPNILSIAIVPVGLTKFRCNLPLMKEYTPDIAAAVIDQADQYGEALLKHYGSRVVYCSDELYIRAHRALPNRAYYETFAQYENGIGMLRLFIDEFEEALNLRQSDIQTRQFVNPIIIASGTLAASYIDQLLSQIREVNPSFTYQVMPITNHFFGSSVTVSGLVTGGDILTTLSDRLGAPARLFIPRNMLQFESELFLDDMTVTEMRERLQFPVDIIEVNGNCLVDALIEKGGKLCYQ